MKNLLLFASTSIFLASSPLLRADAVEKVSVENFARAESDLYFAAVVKNGGFAKLHHDRELTAIDNQTVIRMNRDTLYSSGVFDLDAGPVTITLPDTGKLQTHPRKSRDALCHGRDPVVGRSHRPRR